MNVFAVENQPKEETTRGLEQFMASQSVRTGCPVLVISYESFRNYANILNESEVGLLLCDEGHRLKNCENQTYSALMGLKTKRRVLLSGTPIQNDLTEYYSLIHFVNPGMLGTRNVSFTISIENVDQNKIEKKKLISYPFDCRNLRRTTKISSYAVKMLAALVKIVKRHSGK